MFDRSIGKAMIHIVFFTQESGSGRGTAVGPSGLQWVGQHGRKARWGRMQSMFQYYTPSISLLSKSLSFSILFLDPEPDPGPTCPAFVV